MKGISETTFNAAQVVFESILKTNYGEIEGFGADGIRAHLKAKFKHALAYLLFITAAHQF